MSALKLICTFVLFVVIKADQDQCPPFMDLAGTNCLLVSEQHFEKQADAKAFCDSQTKEGRKGRLFLPTTKEHTAAAVAYAKEQKAAISCDVEHVWTGWEKDPATKTIISSSRPGLTMPGSIWAGPNEPKFPVEKTTSLKNGKYKEGCIVAVAGGVGDVECETWAGKMNRKPYAMCEFY